LKQQSISNLLYCQSVAQVIARTTVHFGKIFVADFFTASSVIYSVAFVILKLFISQELIQGIVPLFQKLLFAFDGVHHK
jgi:hypothetical protein